VIGASGYTGVELIKILLRHEFFEITYFADSSGEERIERLYPAFRGVFEGKTERIDVDQIAKSCELAFLALPHTRSMEVVPKLLDRGVKVVDLSADYRLTLKNYEKNYVKHTDPHNIQRAVYGLPELYREKIKGADLAANPGCYPTAAILALAPFAKHFDKNMPVFVDAKSGVSGAGKKCSTNTHFVKINENVFPYSPVVHRHAAEISQKLGELTEKEFELTFVPHLLPVTRGMLVDCYFGLQKDLDPLELLYDFYSKERFIRIVDSPPDVKSVAGTHFCDIFAMRNGSSVYICAAIDNLLRGASSSAVANANLMFDIEEGHALSEIAYIP